jgi:hypothetical protein
MCDDVLCGFAFPRVATHGNEHARVVGKMSHKLAVANGVGPNVLHAGEIRHRRGLGCITRVQIKGLVCITRVKIKGCDWGARPRSLSVPGTSKIRESTFMEGGKPGTSF